LVRPKLLTANASTDGTDLSLGGFLDRREVGIVASLAVLNEPRSNGLLGVVPCTLPSFDWDVFWRLGPALDGRVRAVCVEGGLPRGS